jgi:energy-coupling factor transporter ATP-binding protein EcfA2
MPRRLLSDLCRLVADRAAVEGQIEAGFDARNAAAEKESQEARARFDERYHREKTATEEKYASARAAAAAKFESEHGTLEKEYEKVRAEVLARFTADQQAAEQAAQDAHWEAVENSDAARGGLNLPLKEIFAGLDSRWHELESIHQQAVALLEQRGHWDEFPEASPPSVILEEQPGRRFCHALEQAQAQLRTLSKQFLPQVFRGVRPLGIVLLLWLLAVGPSVAIFGWQDWHWAAVSGGFAAIVGIIAGTWIHYVARRKSVEAYLALRRTLMEAGLGRPGVLEAAKAECQRLDTIITQRHRTQTRKADEEFAAAKARIERRKQIDMQRAEATYPKRLAELVAWRDRVQAEIEAKYPPLIEQIEERYRTESERLNARDAQTMEESRERFEREWSEMAERWRTGMERFRASAEQLQSICQETFPDWNTDDWSRYAAPTAIPPIVRFGGSSIRLAEIKGGLPEDERLRPAQLDFTLPALVPYPRRSLLLLKTNGPGRARAIDLMQSVMLRLLTALPPGKVRFTILDPVGLGDNFSAFMNLADFDEQLVASRIWTDSGHIEQRLADLTKHMENVIQVYLRQEFHSIEEYNAFAGEMAEPYRVLVVANFPANFSEAAVGRMKSIVASGARCGVFVLMSVDSKLSLPRNFQLSDWESEAMLLRWNEGRFVIQHPDFGPLPIDFDPPPAPERFKEILRTVGNAAKGAGRVEVPFSHITPEEKDWWTANSSAGIDVPLGRAGAMKLQHLNLGIGTSQHVLISGKTGSGKSTLLHVLITNMALHYSPDEVQLYLVDFKKGVEFKAYARAGLPHARVVAIESEREFGLSVLERLDAELRTRGDLFRKQGVQDLKGFRAAVPEARLPRILLIIDEFQELFVEDDRVAQESALLLDRLVRQGRAFGIHVLLGSQTLGGAYSLARSTIGQMAVRIALQCSEADAHLILSEDNTAARLLTRPGEAIYNDANGLYEGNHPFQVVWLTDSDRDDFLRRIAELARQKQYPVVAPIVFEGNVLADPADNRQLKELLVAPRWPESAPTVPAWLGSAVAIKDPTAAVFVRQNGSNLLLVGHREEAALGVMASCFISLLAQSAVLVSPLLPGEGPGVRAAPEGTVNDPMESDLSLPSPHPSPLPEGEGTEQQASPLPEGEGTEQQASSLPVGEGTAGPRFYILDGVRPDAPEVGFWNRLASVAPQTVKLSGVRGAAEIIGEIAAELALRHQQGQDVAPPIYLFLYNLGRFRDLKKEEEFSFSSGEDKADSPAKQFAAILRDGPPLGIHSLVWCDTFSNLSRMLDRQSLRDFEMRVLFQMNANDSSSLTDTPEASRLGVHRALFYDEGQGRMEKFRPYGLPSPEWLAWVKSQFEKREESESSGT